MVYAHSAMQLSVRAQLKPSVYTASGHARSPSSEARATSPLKSTGGRALAKACYPSSTVETRR
eukprot:8892315-Pyramimonas_sp.AAC.1